MNLKLATLEYVTLKQSMGMKFNRDWHHLIDLCAMAGTLVIDHDGVYNPNLLNDRLLLGLKGTMSEFEISLYVSAQWRHSRRRFGVASC
jgi:hypothetical protein